MLTDALAVLLIGGCASFFDVRERRVPNIVSLLGLVAGLALSLFGGWHGLRSALLGAGVFGGTMFVFWWFGWIGGGDAKVAFALGAILGYPLAIAGLFFGIIIGGLFSVGFLVWSFGRRLPFLARSAERFGLGAAVAVGVGRDDAWRVSQPGAVFLSLGALAAMMPVLLGGH